MTLKPADTNSANAIVTCNRNVLLLQVRRIQQHRQNAAA
jgi:hypothetical protein